MSVSNARENVSERERESTFIVRAAVGVWQSTPLLADGTHSTHGGRDRRGQLRRQGSGSRGAGWCVALRLKEGLEALFDDFSRLIRSNICASRATGLCVTHLFVPPACERKQHVTIRAGLRWAAHNPAHQSSSALNFWRPPGTSRFALAQRLDRERSFPFWRCGPRHITHRHIMI